MDKIIILKYKHYIILFLMRVICYIVVSLVVVNMGYNKDFSIIGSYQSSLSNSYNSAIDEDQVYSNDYLNTLNNLGILKKSLNVLEKNVLPVNKENLNRLDFFDGLNNSLKFTISLFTKFACNVFMLVIGALYVLVEVAYSDWQDLFLLITVLSLVVLEIAIYPLIAIYFIFAMLFQSCTFGYIFVWLFLSIIGLFSFCLFAAYILGGKLTAKEYLLWISGFVKRIFIGLKIYF